MQIHLHSEIFEQVVNGTKNVEARVNDEKRQKIKIGDIITILKRPDEIETLNIRVTALKYFKTFTEVADEYSIGRLYSPNYTREEYLDLFRIFYSDEEISEYGVVAIEFELI